MSKTDKLKIALLYFFLFAGGLWHFLNVFQAIMSYLAGPLLIALSIWLYIEIYKVENSKLLKKFNIWCIFAVITSFLIETIGVKTGQIFGQYNYGETLWPKFMGVPISIGFAWFLMLISSIKLSQHIPLINKSNILIQILVISLLMTIFDFLMEPAAIKLNYWNWQTVNAPLQNYIAWFIISFLLLIPGQLLNVLKIRMPILVMHAYFAQLVYFIMIIVK